MAYRYAFDSQVQANSFALKADSFSIISTRRAGERRSRNRTADRDDTLSFGRFHNKIGRTFCKLTNLSLSV